MGAGVVGRSGFEGIVAAATVEEVADRFGHDMSRVGIERRTEGPVHEVAILPGLNFWTSRDINSKGWRIFKRWRRMNIRESVKRGHSGSKGRRYESKYRVRFSIIFL